MRARARVCVCVTTTQGLDDASIQAAVAPGPEDPQPLTEEEIEERERLLKEGFTNWTRK